MLSRNFDISIYILYCPQPLSPISPSALQTKTLFANSVGLNKTVHHEDLHCLPFCFDFGMRRLLGTMAVSKFRDGIFHFRNSVVKSLIRLHPRETSMVQKHVISTSRRRWNNILIRPLYVYCDIFYSVLQLTLHQENHSTSHWKPTTGISQFSGIRRPFLTKTSDDTS